MISEELKDKIIKAFELFTDDRGQFILHNKTQLSLLTRRMKKLGFYKLKGFTARGPFYTNGKIVVKRPFTTVGAMPKRAVETIFLPVKNDEIWIQPLVNTKIKKIPKDYEYNEDYGSDPHKWNIGKYKNKYVVFDW